MLINAADMADMYLGRREALETADHHHDGLEQKEELNDLLNTWHKGPKILRTAHPHDIEDCEDLLENYFMQVNSSLSPPFRGLQTPGRGIIAIMSLWCRIQKSIQVSSCRKFFPAREREAFCQEYSAWPTITWAT